MKTFIAYLLVILSFAACTSSPSAPKTVENMVGAEVTALNFDTSSYWENIIAKAQSNKITISSPSNGSSFPLIAHHAPIKITGQYHNTEDDVAKLMLHIYTNAQKDTKEKEFFRGFVPAKASEGGFNIQFDLNLPWQEGLFYYVIQEHKTRSYIAGGKFEVRNEPK